MRFFVMTGFSLGSSVLVTDLSQVVDGRQCMCLFEHIEQPVLLFLGTHLVDAAFLVIHVTEYDSVCCACLLTSSFGFTILNGAAFFLGSQFSILQALYAERTFFHYTAATNHYVRVQYHAGQVIVHISHIVQVVFEAVCTVEVSPVKAAYFIRTVVGAVTGTDTTVICHLVNTFRAVVGSSHRTNVLTGSIITVLAQHRLEHHFRVVLIEI